MSALLVAAVDWIVGMTALTALVYVAARVAERALAGRVSARLRMALYLALVARMLLPVRWSGGLHVVDGAVAKATRVVPTIAPTSESAALRVVEIVTGTGLPWPALVALGVYAAGVVALLLVRGLARRGLSTGLRPARPSLAASSCGAPVFESDDVGPVVVGVLRPRIVVPTWLADSLDADAMRWIVRHETAHVAARDPLLLGAAQFVAIALWPVAPIWFALRRVRALMEVACDERTLVGSSAAERSGFMRLQAQVAAMQTRRVRVFGAPAFGGDLGERFRALISTVRRWPRFAQAAIVGVVAAALVACASSTDAAAGLAAARTDFVLVNVLSLPVEDEHPVPGARSDVAHLVSAEFLSALDGDLAVRARSHGVATIRSRGAITLDSVDPARGWPISYPMTLVADDIKVDHTFCTLDTPPLIARDGEEASISIETAPRSITAGFTAHAVGDDGTVDLSMRLEERVGGGVVRDLASSTVRLAKGQSALVAMRRPKD